MLVPELERTVGMEVYATSTRGIGGVIRRSAEDFIVEEVLVDGSKAEITEPNGAIAHEALGSSFKKDHFLLCVLVKRNWDTLSAIKAVADQIGVEAERIQVAGLKDAKAVTAQHVTIEDASIEEAQKVKLKDVELRPLGYFRSKLSAYYLLGNDFHIVVSSINHSESSIEKQVTNTVEKLGSIGGAPNFFGHQRFGTTRPITHLVGKAMLREDFREAAMLFLAKPSSHEHPASREAREALQKTQDFTHASKAFPKQLRYELSMLGHLVRKPEDYVGAFRRLPLKLQELFPQAYQSYLFNRFLSDRIANGTRTNEAEIGDYAMNVERSGLPMQTMHKMVTAENIVEIKTASTAGRMKLAIPLIGFRQHLSLGLQGEIEKRVLEEEGIEPENFKIKSLPEISLRGELRTAIAPLHDFALSEATQDPNDSSKRMARVSFMLHRSSYATVVLREIMKPQDLITAGF